MARIASHQFLGVGHDHFDRSPRLGRQVISHHAVHQRTFAAKIAANRCGIDADLRFSHPDGSRKLGAGNKRRLIGKPDIHFPSGAMDHAGMRLHITLMNRWDVECVLKDLRGLGKARLDIAMCIPHLRYDIWNRWKQPIIALVDKIRNRRMRIPTGVSVHSRRLVAHGFHRVVHGWKRLVFDVDQGQRFFSNIH